MAVKEFLDGRKNPYARKKKPKKSVGCVILGQGEKNPQGKIFYIEAKN